MMIDESRETPLTDAVEQKFRLLKLNPATAALQLARTLEHALAAAKAEVKLIIKGRNELENELRKQLRAAESALRKEREKVIEECAEVAEGINVNYSGFTGTFYNSNVERALRALKEKP